MTKGLRSIRPLPRESLRGAPGAETSIGSSATGAAASRHEERHRRRSRYADGEAQGQNGAVLRRRDHLHRRAGARHAGDADQQRPGAEGVGQLDGRRESAR